MKSMIAMIHREYLEHRGAFLYAPAILLALFTLSLAAALAFNKVRMPFDIDQASALRFFEFGFLGMGFLWFVYLMGALFFYFADAFNADRRNNAMLFWKSMPLSDLQVLGSKMLAGLTLLPALIFAALLVTGMILYGLTAAAITVVPGLVIPSIGDIVMSSVEMGSVAFVYIALALLWYAPFFAWVGTLSTIVGRWSIPLAFLIPGLAILAENLFVRGVAGIIGNLLVPVDAPRGGYIFDFLRERSMFGFQSQHMEDLTDGRALDGYRLIGELVAAIDWTQMVGGLIVAALLVFIASEYRRRVIST